MCVLDLKNLTNKEKEAVKCYKINSVDDKDGNPINNNAAGDLNTFLTTNKTINGSTTLPSECKEIDEGLQSIFNSNKFQPITKNLYRACGFETIPSEAITKGGEFSYQAYMSTSSDESEIQNHCDSEIQVILKINVCDKGGIIPLEYRQNDKSEKEYLINKSSNFKVIEVNKYHYLTDELSMKAYLPAHRLKKTKELYYVTLKLL